MALLGRCDEFTRIAVSGVPFALEVAVPGRAPSVILYSTLASIPPPLRELLAARASKILGEPVQTPVLPWLHKVATRDDPPLPSRLREILDGISALGSEDGSAILFAAARARGIDLVEMHGIRSPIEFAVRACLECPSVFDDARTRRRSVEPRLFALFTRPHGKAPVTEEMLQRAKPAIVHGVNEWKRSRACPPGCDIEIVETHSLLEVSILSQRMLSGFRTPEREPVMHAPERLDLLLLEPAGDLLAVHAHHSDAEFYRRIVGTILYDDANAFTVGEPLQLDRLLSAGESEAATRVVPGLQRIEIRNIELRTPNGSMKWMSDQHLNVTEKALFDAIEAAERGTANVDLELFPTGRHYGCSVALRPPNHIEMDHRAIGRHTFRFMRARGLLQV